MPACLGAYVRAERANYIRMLNYPLNATARFDFRFSKNIKFKPETQTTHRNLRVRSKLICGAVKCYKKRKYVNNVTKSCRMFKGQIFPGRVVCGISIDCVTIEEHRQHGTLWKIQELRDSRDNTEGTRPHTCAVIIRILTRFG